MTPVFITSPKLPRQDVDIYDFFDILMQMLKKAGILKETPEEDHTKIRFLDAYPDENYDGGDVIIYNVGTRSYFTHASITQPEKTTQRRPLLVREYTDLEKNCVVRQYGNLMTNSVQLSCWSSSSTQVRKLVQMVETAVFKYKPLLEMNVQIVTYLQQSPTVFVENYFKKRLFSKTIELSVVTLETFDVIVEEIQEIKLST